jgi:hypothetical protein
MSQSRWLAARRTLEFDSRRKARDYFFMSRPAWGTSIPCCPMCTGFYFPWVKRPGRETDTCNSEAKNMLISSHVVFSRFLFNSWLLRRLRAVVRERPGLMPGFGGRNIDEAGFSNSFVSFSLQCIVASTLRLLKPLSWIFLHLSGTSFVTE